MDQFANTAAVAQPIITILKKCKKHLRKTKLPV